MGLDSCPIQHLCKKYTNGTKQRDEYARSTIPCKVFLDMTCEKGVDLQIFLNDGEGIACDINKIQRIKESIKEQV